MPVSPVKILFVDDDQIGFENAKRTLETSQDIPCIVDWANTSQQALKHIRNESHDVYLIDGDINSTTGVDFLRTAREEGSTAPLIYLGGRGDPEETRRALTAGATECLSRDSLRSDELSRTVRFVIEKKQFFEELQYRLEFEQLVTRVTTRFINISPEEVDKEIESALSDLGRFLNVDRSYVFLTSESGDLVSMTHEWHSIQVEEAQDVYLNRPRALFQPLFDRLGKREAVHFPETSTLPDSVAELRDLLLARDVRSFVAVPMITMDQAVGFLGLATIGRVRQWSSDEISLLEIVGQVFANILERKRTERALRDSEFRYRALIEGLAEGILFSDREDRVIHVNSRFAEMTGFTTQDLLGKKVQDTLVPKEYLEFFLKQNANRLQGKSDQYEIEFFKQDGSRFWAEVKAAPVLNSAGQILGSLGAITDVTQRRRNLEQLIASEERFRKYFEIPLVGISITSIEGQITEANSKLCEILGYSRAELLNKTFSEFTHPEDIQPNLDIFEKALNGEIDSYSLDKRYIRKDGNIIHASISSACVRDGDGKAEYFITVYQDRTERRLAEKKIHHQRTFLRRVIDVMPNLIYVKDSQGRFVLVNQAVADAFGVDIKLLKGKKERDFNPSSQLAARYAQQDREVIETGKSLFIPEEIIIDPATGEERWYQTIKAPLPSIDGSEVHVLGVSNDITERKRAEDTLRAITLGTARATAENFFHSLVYQLALVLGVKSAFIGEIDSHNPEFINIHSLWLDDHYVEPFSFRIEDAPSKHVLENNFHYIPKDAANLFPKDSWMTDNKIQGYMGQALTDSAGSTVGLLAVMQDKLLPESPNTKALLSIFAARAGAEIERLRVDSERETLQQQLLQSQKLEAIGQLAAGIAHDLNNALGAVVGHLQLIKMEERATPSVETSADIALRGCERASSLIEQLLGFSRQGKYNLRTVRLDSILNETLDFLSKVIGKGIQIEIHSEEGIPWIEADVGQAQQVLTNLIINATHAMESKGKLRFYFEHKTVPHPERYNQKASPGKFVALTVEDSGVGIPPDCLDRIFDPFFTTKSEKVGTGLGLSMVYGIMQSHGGWITVDSTVEQGSSFVLYFPASSNEDAVMSEEKTESPDTRATGNILVIDDESFLVDLTKTFLTKRGFMSEGFTSGNAAIDWYEDNWATIDLIVLDMKMPEMDGAECFEKIREINPEAKVVILSGYIHDEAAQDLLERGALHFFQKPLKYPDLVDWIAERLQ